MRCSTFSDGPVEVPGPIVKMAHGVPGRVPVQKVAVFTVINPAVNVLGLTQHIVGVIPSNEPIEKRKDKVLKRPFVYVRVLRDA